MTIVSTSLQLLDSLYQRRYELIQYKLHQRHSNAQLTIGLDAWGNSPTLSSHEISIDLVYILHIISSLPSYWSSVALLLEH